MNSNLVCVDANLVVRLVANPVDSATWQLWNTWSDERRQVIAPALLHCEVANALFQYFRIQRMSMEAVREALDVVMMLPVQLRTTERLHTDALELTARFGLKATYDAHYLALAQQTEAEFWTADRRLVDAVGATLTWVRLLDT